METIFATEPLFPHLWDEVQPLFKQHYDEVQVNKAIKLDPDVNAYKKMNELNMIETHTVRHDGVLVGYSFFILSPHLHYKSSFTAVNDLLYISPEFRKGWLGYRFIKFVISQVKKRKPQRILFHVKPHVDFGRVLIRLGAKINENTYSITTGL